MAIYERSIQNKKDKNGVSTNREGKVYDVNLKYRSEAGYWKTYAKRGFKTKREALDHEAQMRLKLAKPDYSADLAKKGKDKLSDYLEDWLAEYCYHNVRPNTYAGYFRNIKNHINPSIGQVPLNAVSGPILDKLYRQMLNEGYAPNTVKYIHRTMSVAMEHAMKYGYIESNPAKKTLTKFSGEVDIPQPYSVEQIRFLLDNVKDPQWRFIIVMGGLYGLRRNEVLGLKWDNVDLINNQFAIVEQRAGFQAMRRSDKDTADLKEKFSRRVLPITEESKEYFLAVQQYRQENIDRLKEFYDDRGFILTRPNGLPLDETHISRQFNLIVSSFDMPHQRFHDLRHAAATNMHQLTGDFYTIGEILGHSLKGIGNTLGFVGGLEAVTERYVDVRLERKRYVLEAYHKAVMAKDEGR